MTSLFAEMLPRMLELFVTVSVPAFRVEAFPVPMLDEFVTIRLKVDRLLTTWRVPGSDTPPAYHKISGVQLEDSGVEPVA